MVEAAALGTGANGKVKQGRKPPVEKVEKEEKAEGAAGRTGRDQQQAVTQPQVVGEKIEELERLGMKAKDAAASYSKAVKVVAEKSGYLASNIRALVEARLGDKFEGKKRDAEQQLELFSEVGE